MTKNNRNLSRYKRNVLDKKLSKKELEKLVKKRINEANARLSSIKRKHGRKMSWASKKLSSRLSIKVVNAFNTKKNIITLPSNASVSQLNAILTAIDKFMISRTSSNKGINETNKQHRDYLKEITDDPEFVDSLTDDDINNVYRLYTDRNIADITEFIDPSELFALCIRAKQYNMSFTAFEEMLLKYINAGNDLDFRESILRVYNLYVAR